MKVRSVAFALLLLAGLAFGQENRGTLSGIITDPSGSPIPKAKIVATETRTGTNSSAVSEDTGQYTIPFLAPGEYQISAEAPGFKKELRKGITLSAGQHPVVDIALEVGQVTEAVTVTAEATPLA